MRATRSTSRCSRSDATGRSGSRCARPRKRWRRRRRTSRGVRASDDKPMIHKDVLSNGLRVLTEPMPAVVSSTIGIWVENGSRYETPARKRGLALHRASALQGHPQAHGRANRRGDRRRRRRAQRVHRQGVHLLLRQGARRRPADDHRAARRPVPATRCSTRPKIDRERQVVLQEISQAEDTPDDFIHDLFNLKFWEGHPLALPIFGSVATVNAIDRELLVSFMADRYRAGRVFIAAAGMVDHQRLVDDCARLFGGVSGDGRSEPIAPPQDRTVVINQRERPRTDPHLHRRPGHQPGLTAALRQLRAEHGARRRDVFAAVPGSARAPRPRLQHLFLHVVVHR